MVVANSFDRLTSTLIAEAGIALEPSHRISRVEIAGGQSKPFQNVIDRRQNCTACFLHTSPTHIGISDSFGKVHWAPRSRVKEAIARYRRDFPDGPKPA